MKTKLFTLLLAVAASIGIMNAVTIDGLNYNLSAQNLTAEVAGNAGASGDIIIPATVIYDTQTYSVTSIGDEAFRACSNLTSVAIPNSVTSIGALAFSGCTGMTSVTIPNSVTSFGSSAFSGCSGLTSIVVESENSTYDSRDNCNAIIETATNKLIVGCKNTIIPNSITSIGVNAFSGCSSLTSATIPNSVTSIGGLAFYGCTGLTSVTIPNSVTSIGNYAFRDCSGLTSITIEAETPSTLGIGVFAETNNCPIYVPCSAEITYKTAWSEYADRIDGSCQGIEEVEGLNGQNHKILHNGRIYILRGDNIYTVTGQEAK